MKAHSSMICVDMSVEVAWVQLSLPLVWSARPLVPLSRLLLGRCKLSRGRASLKLLILYDKEVDKLFVARALEADSVQ